MTPDEVELWIKFEADRSIENRNALVEFYMPFLRTTVAKKAKSIPPTATNEYEDLENDAVPALIKCVERFDRSRGYRFETYAAKRIVGQVLDELRNRDWLPRAARLHASMHSIEIATMFPMSAMGTQNKKLDRQYEFDICDPNARQNFEDDFWRVACRGMNRTERLVVLMYFRLHKTMNEISRHVGISESRISQMMKSITQRLRETNGKRLEEEGRAA